MPTDQTRLTNAIQTALETQTGNQTDAAAARQQLASAIAGAVLIEIKAVLVTYTSGLVDGSGRPVLGVFNNNIS